MSYEEYLDGLQFIKDVAGTPEEQERREKEWRTMAYPLVNATLKEPAM